MFDINIHKVTIKDSTVKVDGNDSEIEKAVDEIDIAGKTPLECMTFIEKLKKLLLIKKR